MNVPTYVKQFKVAVEKATRKQNLPLLLPSYWTVDSIPIFQMCSIFDSISIFGIGNFHFYCIPKMYLTLKKNGTFQEWKKLGLMISS